MLTPLVVQVGLKIDIYSQSGSSLHGNVLWYAQVVFSMVVADALGQGLLCEDNQRTSGPSQYKDVILPV